MVRQEIDLPFLSSGTNPQSMAVIVRECKTQDLIILPETAARVQTRPAMKRRPYCSARAAGGIRRRHRPGRF